MLKYFIVVLVFIYGCKNHGNQTNIIFSKFPVENSITLNNLIKYDNGVVSRMFLNDTSLVVYDWRGNGGYFFYEYGLTSKEIVNKYVPKGSGKGQGLGSLSAGIHNNVLWMYDLNLNKIIFLDLKTSSFPTDAHIYKEYPFSKKYYNIQFLSNTTIIANGNYQTPTIIQEVDLNSGKITADYGVLDSVPENIPFYAWKHANESLMVLNPAGSKAVLTHLFNDHIEIFDVNSHKSITVSGPENYKLEFEPMKSDDGQDLIQRNERSRLAFTNVVGTDKFIYALYSGENRSNPNSIYGKIVYVYDWDGKPIKKINLDRYVSSLAVSNDDKTLYAFDVVSKYIVTAKI